MVGHKLEIKSDGSKHNVVGYGMEILLDGQPLEYVTSLSLTIQPGETNEATISFIPGEIDVDATTLAALEAIVKERENAEV